MMNTSRRSSVAALALVVATVLTAPVVAGQEAAPVPADLLSD